MDTTRCQDSTVSRNRDTVADMNQSASRPRLTRGAHDPKAHAYNIVGLFSQIIPLLAYLGRTLNDTMCDHYSHPIAEAFGSIEASDDICERCQKRLYTVGTLISGSSSAVADWTPGPRALLDARLAIAAARRLVDVVEFGEPVAWAMKGGTVVTTARHAINAAAALLEDPDLETHNAARDAAQQCREMDLSTCRVARKHGLEQESFIIGFVLKAASKAADAAAAAIDVVWSETAGPVRGPDLAKRAEDIAGAALGAALDGAGKLQGTGRPEAMMAVATGICAEFDRLARPAETYGKGTSQKAMPGVSPVETPTEEYDVMQERNGIEVEVIDVDDFESSGLGDVADEAIGDAAAALADLERAETILNAVVAEHRAVEQCVRTTREDGANAGLVTEYYQKCCVVCRDAKGRPIPAPCRTMLIVQAYGEGVS